MDCDWSPLCKITRWDQFEAEIQEDTDQCKAAQILKGRHSKMEEGGIFVSLEKAVRSYHASVKELLEESPHNFMLIKVLQSGPNFLPEQ